jgi:hypothetical protein
MLGHYVLEIAMRAMPKPILLSFLLCALTATAAAAETPVAGQSPETALAAASLAQAAAKEAQKLRHADEKADAGAPAKVAGRQKASAASDGAPNVHQQKLRESERLRVRDRYRTMQQQRIASQAAAGREQASNASDAAAPSDQAD